MVVKRVQPPLEQHVADSRVSGEQEPVTVDERHGTEPVELCHELENLRVCFGSDAAGHNVGVHALLVHCPRRHDGASSARAVRVGCVHLQLLLTVGAHATSLLSLGRFRFTRLSHHFGCECRCVQRLAEAHQRHPDGLERLDSADHVPTHGPGLGRRGELWIDVFLRHGNPPTNKLLNLSHLVFELSVVVLGLVESLPDLLLESHQE
mmetsp:Transcript_18280/g.42962  ORF Transcript_18280/g.42962 Transcript_18280/m.42962 type:complete len:207 (-) Transcript_18280:855-1475(-)